MRTSLETVEVTSYKKARILYDNWEEYAERNPEVFDRNERKRLQEYMNGAEIKGDKAKKKIYYHYKSGKIGRQYVYGYGLQNMKREIRQTIAGEYYEDIDMVNSEPTLLLGYCKKAKYGNEGIKYYCENREKCLKELMRNSKCNREEAKRAVIKIINGGNPYPESRCEWFDKFKKDVKEVHKSISENPAYKKRLSEISEEKGYNEIGTLISEIFQEIENECLCKCIEYVGKMNKKALSKIVLIFDGFMISREEHIDERWLKELSEYVTKETGYEVKYIKKEMNDTIDTTNMKQKDDSKFEIRQLKAKNDEEAGEIVANTLEGQCYCCRGNIWIRTRKDRIYVCDEETIDIELIGRCMAMNIKKENGNKLVEYSANIKSARSIAQSAKIRIKTDKRYVDDKFVDRMIKYTKDKIFYKNGYIMMTDGGHKVVIERDEEDYEIITPVRICMDVPEMEYITDEIRDNLYKRVLMPIFGKRELMKNYLQHVARAITGHIEDKDWLIMQGMRNCGKGVLTLLNKYTFDVYANETGANNFIMERQHTVEDPKKYAWLGQNMWTRILTTSEIKCDNNDRTIKVDGNLIKGKLTSGGDTVEVRDLYQRAIKITPQCRLFMMCNDIPPFAPPDALQTVTKITFPSQFVEKNVYDNMKKEGTLNVNTKLADLSVKNYVMRKDVCDCYLSLVINAYTKEKVVNCNEVEEDTKEMKVDMGDETSIITSNFKFTGRKEDYILSSELVEYNKRMDMNISIVKLRSILKFNGAKMSNHLGEDKTQRGYIGVKFIKEDS